jgi:hypothetical protein
VTESSALGEMAAVKAKLTWMREADGLESRAGQIRAAR